MNRTLDQVKVSRASQNKFDFRLGDYINQSFKIFGDNWLQFALFTLVSAIISILSVVTIIGPYLVMFPLQMGYGHVVDKIENGESFEFNDFFKGFEKWTRFIPFFLLMLGFSLLLMIPFVLLMGGFGLLVNENESFAPLFSLSIFAILPLFIIIGILLSVVTFFTPYIIYYGNYGVIDSIKLSYKIGMKNFWYILLTVLLYSILSQIGAYICFVGILATFPIAQIMAYLLVKDFLLTDDQKTEIDLLGTNQE